MTAPGRQQWWCHCAPISRMLCLFYRTFASLHRKTFPTHTRASTSRASFPHSVEKWARIIESPTKWAQGFPSSSRADEGREDIPGGDAMQAPARASGHGNRAERGWREETLTRHHGNPTRLLCCQRARPMPAYHHPSAGSKTGEGTRRGSAREGLTPPPVPGLARRAHAGRAPCG
jgi:hypothetical protein